MRKVNPQEVERQLKRLRKIGTGKEIEKGDLVRNTKAMPSRRGLIGIVVEQMAGENGPNSYCKVKWFAPNTTLTLGRDADSIWYKRTVLVKVD